MIGITDFQHDGFVIASIARNYQLTPSALIPSLNFKVF